MTARLFVVTGGPGAGKTSLIAALAQRGLATMPESGRAIIREQLAGGGNALPWADRSAYAALMLRRDLATWRAARMHGRTVVLDRGIPDILGYLRLCGLPVPTKLRRAAQMNRYRPTVFIAPHWPAIYCRDTERRQDEAEARATCAIMAATYRALGYRLIRLPCAGIQARADLVMRALSGSGPCR